jgi:hypothetical protein
MLVAGHIKPWKDSTSAERMDLRNSLAACPSHDVAFDAGLREAILLPDPGPAAREQVSRLAPGQRLRRLTRAHIRDRFRSRCHLPDRECAAIRV